MKHSTLKEALKKEIRKVLKEELDEMARIATTIKIGDPKAAAAAKEQYAGKWIADMITAVENAGKEGIAQPALATAIGKGSQQVINPKVREFLASNVFTTGESDTPKSEPKITKTEKPKAEPKKVEPKLKKSIEKVDDEDVKDDYEKSDTDDSEDDEVLAKKATPNKGVQSKAKQLDDVLKDMKQLAKDYKTAKETGDKKSELEIVDKLKAKQKEKSKLEKAVHVGLGSEDDEN